MVALPVSTEKVAIPPTSTVAKPVGDVMGDVLQRYGLQLPARGAQTATSCAADNLPVMAQLSGLSAGAFS